MTRLLRRSGLFVALLLCHAIVASLATHIIARLQGFYITVNILYARLRALESECLSDIAIFLQAVPCCHHLRCGCYPERLPELRILRIWRLH